MSVILAAYRESIILTPLSKRLEIAGSIRRNKPTPNDVDLVLVPIDIRKILEYVSQYSKGNTGRGNTHASYRKNGVEIELYFSKEENFGAALLYVTGSNEYNIMLRTYAKFHNMKLSQYGLFKDGRMIAGRDEESIYAALGKKGRILKKEGCLEASEMTYRGNHTILRHYRNKVATADIVCPNCGSGDSIWRDGFKVTRQGRKQRYQCHRDGCGFKFVQESGKKIMPRFLFSLFSQLLRCSLLRP